MHRLPLFTFDSLCSEGVLLIYSLSPSLNGCTMMGRSFDVGFELCSVWGGCGLGPGGGLVCGPTAPQPVRHQAHLSHRRATGHHTQGITQNLRVLIFKKKDEAHERPSFRVSCQFRKLSTQVCQYSFHQNHKSLILSDPERTSSAIPVI